MEILQGEIGSEVTVKNLENKQSVMLNSPGGSLFAGLAMYDYVKANDIEIGIIGLCASAATLPLIASSKRWGTPNSRYMIHNPSLHFFIEQFDADDLQRNADELRKEQTRALNLYFEILNKSKEEIQEIMDKDIFLDANEALELGLITEIRDIPQDVNVPETQDLKLLYNKFKMQINTKEMENKELKTELTGIKSILNSLFKMLKPVKMLILQDVNGKELDFGSDVETEEQVVLGVSATIDGSPAEGEFTMPDGKVFVFEKGVLTAINEPSSDEVETLKKENEDLKIENEILNEEKAAQAKMIIEFESKLKEVSMKLDFIQSKFSTEKAKDNLPPVESTKTQNVFSYKRKIINN